MTNTLKVWIRGAAAFGAGHLLAVVAVYATLWADRHHGYFWFFLVPASGAGGAVVFFFRELRPLRTLLAAVGFGFGFLAAMFATVFLEHLVTSDFLEHLITSGLHVGLASRLLTWAGQTLALAGGFALGGAIGAFSVRPSLTLVGARAFAIGGVALGLTISSSVLYRNQDSGSPIELIVAFLAAYCAGGGFFAYWYHKRKERDAANESREEGESAG